MKRIHQNSNTKHHIIPSSRGGSDAKKNIAKVRHRIHDLYHRLFENMLPREILEYINKTFWNSKYIITIREA